MSAPAIVDPTEVTRQQEAHRHMHNLCSMATYSATMDKATAKQLLQVEWVFCHGEARNIKVKHLGLGVYKVYSEPRP